MGPDATADANASAVSPNPGVPRDVARGGAPNNRREQMGRAAVTITFWNLISRVTGFVRVIAIASALGIAALGDGYQRANEVSNVLFELLAGGLLFSVLIPTFVELLQGREPDRARELAGALLGRGLAVLGGLVVVGMVASHWIMQALTVGMTDATREAQVDLGAFLLLFILPQLLFYAAGSVASALLQADHRFVATSVAPVFNNVVVTATMIAFALEHDPSRGFALTTGEKVLLGAGTLAGTVAMTVVPFVALRYAGMGIRTRWRSTGGELRTLARRGMWGAGHIGLNEVLIGVTVVLAGRVDGGVIAYQTAFTFFLLPHALLAHPIFTALFPRLSRRAGPDQRAQFAADLSLGLRSMLFLVLPAAGMMGAAAPAALSIVRLGQLNAHGTRLVALVLASYLVGLAGYSSFYLLTRASYALGDARRPTIVNAVVTVVAVVAMVVAVAGLDGTALLVAFGVINAVTVTGGSVVLHVQIRRELGVAVPVVRTVARSALGAAAATAVGLGVAALIGWHRRLHAVAAVVAVGVAGVLVYTAALAMARAPELALVRDRAVRLARRVR